MLGPSFSPSIARMPGPTSSQSRYQRRPWRRAWWNRDRSAERAASSASAAAAGARRRRRSRWARRARRRQRSTSTRIARGKRHRAREPRRRSGRTAARRTAACRSPRTRPRGDPKLGEEAQHLRIGIRDARERSAGADVERLQALGGALLDLSSRVGIGSPCGSWVGSPSLAAISSSSSSESTCSSTSASAWTRSQGTPRLSTRYSSSRR